MWETQISLYQRTMEVTQGYSLPTDDGGNPGILMKLKGVGSEEVPTKDVILEMIPLTKMQEQLHQYNKDAEESLHMSLGEMTPKWLTS